MEWSTVIRELQASGLTQTQIAEKVGATQPIVSDLRTGRMREPRYELGSKLLALHRLESRKRRAA